MPNETEVLRTITRAIITRGALSLSLENPVRWASGYAMPIYIDNRCLIGYPDVREAIAEAFALRIKESGIAYDAIAGVATGAIPHATTLADKLGLPLLFVRPKPKDHGAGRQVEGFLPGTLAGKNVLVIEDTVSTGGSVVNAVEALRREGALVTNVATIFYYDFPVSPSKISQMNPTCSLSPLLTFPTLMQMATEEGLIAPETATELLEWFKNPFEWGASKGLPKLEA